MFHNALQIEEIHTIKCTPFLTDQHMLTVTI